MKEFNTNLYAEKIQLINDSIQQQLGTSIFLGNVKIPITFILNNEKSDSLNVFSVSSKEEAEQIIHTITKSTTLIDNVKDYSNPLYLTVIAKPPL